MEKRNIPQLSIDLSTTKSNGWIELPASVKRVIVYFKNGHNEEMDLLNFLTLKPQIKKQIVKIECYEK